MSKNEKLQYAAHITTIIVLFIFLCAYGYLLFNTFLDDEWRHGGDYYSVEE